MHITTIKVPSDLRDRVQRHAKRERVSGAVVIGRALDLLEKEQFFEQLRRDVTERPEDQVAADARERWLAGEWEA